MKDLRSENSHHLQGGRLAIVANQGSCTMSDITQHQSGYSIFQEAPYRKLQGNQDVRVLLKGAALKQTQFEPSFPLSVDIDKSTCEQLLDDHTGFQKTH